MRGFQMLLAATACLPLALVGGPALAQPPPGADLKYKDWFESLQQPGTHSYCCSISDCHMTAYRTTANGYEVPIGDRWVPVPPDKILDHVDNPTGHAVVCYLEPDEILCFVREAEG
jgi:hypothetical protein